MPMIHPEDMHLKNIYVQEFKYFSRYRAKCRQKHILFRLIPNYMRFLTYYHSSNCKGVKIKNALIEVNNNN